LLCVASEWIDLLSLRVHDSGSEVHLLAQHVDLDGTGKAGAVLEAIGRRDEVASVGSQSDRFDAWRYVRLVYFFVRTELPDRVRLQIGCGKCIGGD